MNYIEQRDGYEMLVPYLWGGRTDGLSLHNKEHLRLAVLEEQKRLLDTIFGSAEYTRLLGLQELAALYRPNTE